MDDTYAWAPAAPEPDFSRSGKWMLFCSSEYDDEDWAKIKAATEAGMLGVAAKTAPKAGKISPAQWETLKTLYPHVTDRFETAKLTCVYTYDLNDHDDIRRVLVALRELGFTGRLSYKTDADTGKGNYSEGVSVYVSQPGSMDFEDRR